MATTAFPSSAKVELMQATHCLNAATTQTASGVNGAFTLTGMASTAAIIVGMAASGTNVAAGAVVASIDSATQVTLSKAHTGTITTQTITLTGDSFKATLIKASPSRTFDGTQTNVGTPGTGSPSATNLGTDEVAAGGGYTSDGLALTNVTPVLSGSVAVASFSPNPSWTLATFSTTGMLIANKSVRQGHANGITPNASGSAINRCVGVLDFGGTQTVAGGTFTAVMPTVDSTHAILRVS